MFKIVQRVPKESDADQQQSPSSPLPHPRVDSKPTTPAAVISRKNENPPPPVIKTNIIQKAVEQATKQGTPTKVLQLQSDTSAPRKLEASVQLINDEQELLDTIKEFLCDGNKKFRVIGAVGSQGTGKSTTLSMLAGNDPMDMYRQYIFRPCAREAVESCRYQSTKISIFVSQKSRVLFLDCQPLNSVPLLEDCSHSYRSKAGPVESLELESLQLLLLLANVCDTLLLCIDWFIDLSIIRRLMRIELFPSFLQSRAVNLVILHQRAKSQDFQPLLVAERIKLLEGIFANTSFDLNGGLTMSALGFTNYDHIKSSVNYIVLGELKPRTRMENYAQDLHQKSRELDYGTVISKLRTKIQTLPRLQPKMELTEGKWFCQMIDFWNKLKQELPQMTEDGCTIRRHYLADSTTATGQGPQQRVHHQKEQQAGKEETLMRARKPGPAIMGKHNSHTHRSPGGEWRPKKKTFQPRKMERTKRQD